MIEQLFPQIYTYQGKRYRTKIIEDKTESDGILLVILNNYVAYETINQDNQNVDGRVYFRCRYDFEEKFKKEIINQK
jgi:hypothetical protein